MLGTSLRYEQKDEEPWGSSMTYVHSSLRGRKERWEHGPKMWVWSSLGLLLGAERAYSTSLLYCNLQKVRKRIQKKVGNICLRTEFTVWEHHGFKISVLERIEHLAALTLLLMRCCIYKSAINRSHLPFLCPYNFHLVVSRTLSESTDCWKSLI